MSVIFVPRIYSRFHVNHLVHYMGAGVLGRGTVVDLSLRGCRIEGDCAVPPGTLLTLRIVASTHAEPIILEQVEVRWEREHTLGVEFARRRSTQLRRLKPLIETLAGRSYASPDGA